MRSRAAPSPARAQVPKALQTLALHHGLQTEYVGMAGNVVRAAPESLLATLRALGVDVQEPNDCQEALEASLATEIARALPHVIVAWNGRLPPLPLLRSVGRSLKKFRVEIHLEQGEAWPCDAFTRQQDRPARSGEIAKIQCRTPVVLPMGYHQITLHLGSQTFHSLVLSAPRRAFADSGWSRGWGFFAPLYALRSQANWGAGDYTDLSRFIGWVSGQGGEVVGTLPLLPVFLDRPFDPSPYSPGSRLFWNEFYIDIERIPEFASCVAAKKLAATPAFRRRIGALRSAARVEYRALAQLKHQMLDLLARHFFEAVTPRHRVFQKFLADHPEVETYARFRAAQESHGVDWSKWPNRVRPESGGESMDPNCRYHLWSQWLAHEQMAEVANSARRHGVRLYLDLPLGVHPQGYDAWRFRRIFAQGALGGAPPDPVFTHGQSWGFAPLHPRALREDGYTYFRSCLRHHLGTAGMLRFDHVMSLHRLYWIPAGMPASLGVYVNYPAEELYAVLNIESHRHQAMIVGENLGTVPPVVNRSLARHGVRSMHVTQYELEGGSQKSLPAPPAACVASLNTHDMPPFAAFWRGADIPKRFALGLLDKSGLNSENARRNAVRRTVARQVGTRIAGGSSEAQAGEVLSALWTHLSKGPAEVVLANLEDVWLETRPQNVPGTSAERDNWRNKVRFAIEQYRSVARDAKSTGGTAASQKEQ